MYFWKSLLYLTILNYLHIADCMVVLDCSDSEHLCPGSHTVELECTTNGSFLGWKGGDYEVDFDYSDLIDNEECQMGICGVLTEKVPSVSYTSRLSFDSSLLADGTVIDCIDLLTNRKSCQISHAAPPSPPSNLQYSQIPSQSFVQFTWSSTPTTTNSSPSYRVTFSPPVGGVSTFSVTANNLSLNMTSFQVNTEYIAEIKAVICDGELPGNESASLTFTLSSTETSTTSQISPTTTALPFSSHTTITTTSTPLAQVSFSITSSTPSQFLPSPTSHTQKIPEPTIGTEATRAHEESTSTDDTESDSDILFLIVSGAVGGVVVLIVMAIILVAFAFIIVVILKRISQPNNNTNSPPDNKPQESTSQELAMITLNQSPPPLPPRPATYKDFSIQLTTNFSPLYDNPIHLYPPSSTQSKQSSSQEYAIPMVARILIPNRNSKTTSV